MVLSASYNNIDYSLVASQYIKDGKQKLKTTSYYITRVHLVPGLSEPHCPRWSPDSSPFWWYSVDIHPISSVFQTGCLVQKQEGAQCFDP